MALKPRIKFNKEADRAEVVYYDGRRKASPEQVRTFIKSNYNNLDASQLNKEDRSYYNKIKAGKARSANAVRIEGRYLQNDFKKKENFKGLAEARGFRTIDELFKNDPVLFEAAKKLYTKTGLPNAYDSNHIQDKIQSFTGKILLNGKKVSNLEAIGKVEEIDKYLKRKFKAYNVIYTIRYTRGGRELQIKIPTKKDIRESNSIEELENGRNEIAEDIDIIISTGKGKKK